MSIRNIGVPGVVPPKERECNDVKCPFHAKKNAPRIRGRILKGVVVSKKSKNTAVIRQDYVHFVKKYQRYERRNSKISAHLPECLWYEIEIGDLVRVGESRKIAKTKAFIVLEKLVKEGEV